MELCEKDYGKEVILETYKTRCAKHLRLKINGTLCKVLCHNLCVVIQSVHELRIDATLQSRAPLRGISLLQTFFKR